MPLPFPWAVENRTNAVVYSKGNNGRSCLKHLLHPLVSVNQSLTYVFSRTNCNHKSFLSNLLSMQKSTYHNSFKQIKMTGHMPECSERSKEGMQRITNETKTLIMLQISTNENKRIGYTLPRFYDFLWSISLSKVTITTKLHLNLLPVNIK